MSLTRQLEQELRTAGTGPACVVVREGDHSLLCELVAIDGVGVTATIVELKSKKLEGVPPEKLRAIADKLAAKVGYLLEAIAPLEIDNEACAIQMRSTPPYRAENATSYYEVLVTAGKISLRRFSKQKRAVREAEPFDITRQVLSRLAEDFAGAAEGS
ncbi:hypothetical protein [Aeoliella sp. SH292]|uniref:hypothetical protein n=1 Tax=Aeoliella sp. SH292 TaxID=3454464 RepID=UPI003F9BC228